MSVTWSISKDDRYEISSRDHLLQVMSGGKLYKDYGSPPKDYMDSDYVQVDNIDLEHDSSVKPIGSTDSTFSGSYDGSDFAISNWALKDEFTENAGLFGYTQSATLKNVRLSGVWYIGNFKQNAGFLVGFAEDTTMRNVEASFEKGTVLSGGETATAGGLVGSMTKSPLEICTLYGDVKMGHAKNGFRGGIVGRSSSSSMIFVRNCGTWEEDIRSEEGHVGGIAAHVSDSTHTELLMNYMVGTLYGSVVGGIFGHFHAYPGTHLTHINSMYGYITGSTLGGIYGRLVVSKGLVSISQVVNYMGGSIKNTSGETSGGIVGELFSEDGDLELVNSCMSMSGYVMYAVLSKLDFSPKTVKVNVDKNFGLECEIDEYGGEFEPEGFERDDDLKGLWFLPMVYQDSEKNLYYPDFVASNVEKVTENYTHASLHNGSVSSPFETEMEFSKEIVRTYTNYKDSSVFSDPELKVLDSTSDVVYDYEGYAVLFGTPPSALKVYPRAVNMLIEIEKVPGAVYYRVGVQREGYAEEFPGVSDTSNSTRNIDSLRNDENYTVRLYTAQSSGVYTLRESLQITTLESNSSSYVKSDFLAGVRYDLSRMDPQSRKDMSEVMNDMFTTGDKLKVSLSNGRSTKIDFVNLGDTLSVVDAEALLFPFDVSKGSGQSATMILSDGSTSVGVVFDETDSTVSILGSKYEVGESFFLDGKKVSVRLS